MEGVTGAALYSVLEVEVLNCAMLLKQLCPISFYTKAVVSTSCVYTKVRLAHSTGTVQDRMLFTKSKFFLVAYFYMPIISKI